MVLASVRQPEPAIPPPHARIALKVDVETYRGTEHGVPRLLEVLKRHRANATFLFSLGPDHTGRAIKRIFCGSAARGRLSAIERYGVKTLLYGTLLPAPDIGVRCRDILRQVAEAGFEVGLGAWDHAGWKQRSSTAGMDWTYERMQRASERFTEIFGTTARVHGAAGWQMNRHAYRLTQRLGFDYCSDTRGLKPFVPVIDAELIACPQVPTTLPTLDELIGLDPSSHDDVDARLLQLACADSPAGHVLTLRAEIEGMKLLPVFERLLERLATRGKIFLSLGDYIAAAGTNELPRHCVIRGATTAGGRMVELQGEEFLA
jgi:undecaprenyl phosphate-alpha-L-ara4FN deformylase